MQRQPEHGHVHEPTVPGQVEAWGTTASASKQEWLRKQIEDIDALVPEQNREYKFHVPGEYGDTEGRRERKHAALAILNDPEILLEHAVENHETLAQTRYRLTHSLLCIRNQERHVIKYSSTGTTMQEPLSTKADVKNIRHSLVKYPMFVQPSQDGTVAANEGEGDPSAPSQVRSQTPALKDQQMLPMVNMVDDQVCDWWGYNDGVYSRPSGEALALDGGSGRSSRRKSGGRVAGSPMGSPGSKRAQASMGRPSIGRSMRAGEVQR